jgi:hypothetical protein
MIQQPDRQDKLSQPNITSRRRMLKHLGIAAAGLATVGGTAGALPSTIGLKSHQGFSNP